MFDKKLIISLVSAVLLYAVLLKTTCEEEYYDRNSMLYAAVVGIFVFLGLRSFADPAASGAPAAGAPGTVGENVMTTPFQ